MDFNSFILKSSLSLLCWLPPNHWRLTTLLNTTPRFSTLGCLHQKIPWVFLSLTWLKLTWYHQIRQTSLVPFLVKASLFQAYKARKSGWSLSPLLSSHPISYEALLLLPLRSFPYLPPPLHSHCCHEHIIPALILSHLDLTSLEICPNLWKFIMFLPTSRFTVKCVMFISCRCYADLCVNDFAFIFSSACNVLLEPKFY